MAAMILTMDKVGFAIGKLKKKRRKARERGGHVRCGKLSARFMAIFE